MYNYIDSLIDAVNRIKTNPNTAIDDAFYTMHTDNEFIKHVEEQNAVAMCIITHMLNINNYYSVREKANAINNIEYANNIDIKFKSEVNDLLTTLDAFNTIKKRN